MKKLLCYNPWYINIEKYKDSKPIQKMFDMYSVLSRNLIIFDRSEVVKSPLNWKNLYPIPKFIKFDKDYESICNDRAKYLIALAESKNINICVMYSGGIDSTLILVSLLKNSTKEQQKRIIVLLSQESIDENPNFYNDHIVGKFKTELSENFEYFCNKKNLLLTGEPNDLVFGSVMMEDIVSKYGSQTIHSEYSRELFFDYLSENNNSNEIVIYYLDMFEKMCSKAPIKIATNFEFIWWIYFCCNWQNVILRPLMYLSEKHIKNIDQDFIENYYFGFYNTNEFQLWSLNNLDKKIKEDWESYKYIAKDIIFNFNGDIKYRDSKKKVPSMRNVLRNFKSYGFLDEDFQFMEDINWKEFYNTENDFL